MMSEKKQATPAELWALWDYEGWIEEQLHDCIAADDEPGAQAYRAALEITRKYREMRGGLPTLKD